MDRSRRSAPFPPLSAEAVRLARRALLLALTAGLAACGRRPEYLEAPPEPEAAPQQEQPEGTPE
jgi:predicted small lipoprotein YifL